MSHKSERQREVKKKKRAVIYRVFLFTADGSTKVTHEAVNIQKWGKKRRTAFTPFSVFVCFFEEGSPVIPLKKYRYI